jgi:sulfite exporter TauE/SafE
MALWTALLVGFLGSFHCVGMCGPIALALPFYQGQDRFTYVLGRILYNLGRALTYASLGLIVGVAGSMISFAGWQQPLSVVLGVIIILVVVLPKAFTRFLSENSGTDSLLSRLKSKMAGLYRKNSLSAMLGIGLMNGLLPCGFVYMGLAGAVTTGSVLSSGVYMFLFGLGTFPAMLVMSLSSSALSLKTRQRINQFIPYLAVALGILFILRGLGLGIPYISPLLDGSMSGM